MKLSSIFTSLIFIVGLVYATGFALMHRSSTSIVASGFTPVQGQTMTLAGAGITSSAATVTMTSGTLPDQNHTPLTMSMFGAIGYGVFEPQSSKVENFSFTGITQNANGTMTLTGVARGLSFYAPYAASTTLQLQHAGGSNVIFSNSAAFYGQQFALLNNASTIGAIWTFGSTTPPTYDGSVSFGTNALALVDKQYVDALSILGAPTSTEATLGVVVLASSTGNSFASTTSGAPLVIENKFATTTPGTICTSGTWNCIVATTLGKISQSFYDLTAPFTVSGLWTFNGGFINNASSTFTNTVNLNGTINGITGKSYINYQPGSIAGSAGTASTTIFAATVPANALGTSNYVTYNIPLGNTSLDDNVNSHLFFEIGYGTATTSLNLYDADTSGGAVFNSIGGMMTVTLAANSSAALQLVNANITLNPPYGGTVKQVTLSGTANVHASFSQDSTLAKQVVVIARSETQYETFTPTMVTGVLYR